MTIVWVDWESAGEGERAQIREHIDAIRQLGATVLEADASGLVRETAEEVCSYLASRDKGEGDVVDRALTEAMLPGGPLNARQRSVLKDAVAYLRAAGVLDEGNGGSTRITKMGAERLYP